MLSTKDRLAQFQKSSNTNPPAASNKLGQAGLKPVSKNGGPAKPADQASKVDPNAKPADQPKSTQAASVKPGEQPKAASKPAEPAKTADQAKTQAGKQDEKSSKQTEQPKSAQPGKQEAAKNPLPTETSKPAEQPKPAVGKPAETPKLPGPSKPAEQAKPVETAKPTGPPKTTEQPKPVESKPAEAAKPTGTSKTTEQPKQAESKPAEPAKPVEQPKVVEPSKPAQQPKPAEQTKQTEQTKPVEQPKPVDQSKPTDKPKPVDQSKPSEQPKTTEQPKPVEQPKSVESKPAEQAKEQTKVAEPTKLAEQSKPAQQPKPTEQPKPALPTTSNPPKPSEVTSQPASTAQKPSDPKVEQTKVAEQMTPASQPKPAEQPKPAPSTAQAKPAEPVKPVVVTQPGTPQVKAPEAKSSAPTAASKVPDQPSKIPVSTTVQVRATGQTTVASVTNTEQPHVSASVKVEPAKTAEPKPIEVVQKPAEVPKPAAPVDQPSKTGEAKAASSDELFGNIFYFSGMGNLIGSALAEGIYVPEKNHSSALELEDIESLRKREEEKRKHEIINVARSQAQGLFGDFQKLQAILEGLPTFTDTLEPKPLERRAVDQPIHGHIYFQQEQQHSRPHSQVHPSGSDNVVTHRQSTTYTTSQVIQPSANTTRIGFDRSPEERSTVSTAHIVPSHLNETASPLRETHHSHLGGYDRLAAKQASLAKDLAERDAFNRSHGSHPAPGGAQNLHYQTVESQFHQSRHEGGHHGSSHLDDAQRQLTGGTLDTTDLKPWQLSHLRGLEARGYHLESHSHSPTHHKQTVTSTSYTSYASPTLPYCDL